MKMGGYMYYLGCIGARRLHLGNEVFCYMLCTLSTIEVQINRDRDQEAEGVEALNIC